MKDKTKNNNLLKNRRQMQLNETYLKRMKKRKSKRYEKFVEQKLAAKKKRNRNKGIKLNNKTKAVFTLKKDTLDVIKETPRKKEIYSKLFDEAITKENETLEKEVYPKLFDEAIAKENETLKKEVYPKLFDEAIAKENETLEKEVYPKLFDEIEEKETGKNKKDTINNVVDLANQLKKLNPSVEFKLGDPNYDALFNKRMYSSVPAEKLILPEGFEYDSNFGITNKNNKEKENEFNLDIEDISLYTSKEDELENLKKENEKLKEESKKHLGLIASFKETIKMFKNIILPPSNKNEIVSIESIKQAKKESTFKKLAALTVAGVIAINSYLPFFKNNNLQNDKSVNNDISNNIPVEEMIVEEKDEPLTFGSLIQIKEDTPIYKESKWAAEKINSDEHYFDDYSELRVVEALSYELIKENNESQIITIFPKDADKIELLEKEGAVLKAVLVNKKDNYKADKYEGFKNIDDIKNINKLLDTKANINQKEVEMHV